MKLQKDLCLLIVTGGEFIEYCRFLKCFYGLTDIPEHFQKRINTILEHKHPACLDDIIIITQGIVEKREAEVRETMTKLVKAGYRFNPHKYEFFKKEIEWVGHKKTTKGIRLLQNKSEAITEIDIPKIGKELK